MPRANRYVLAGRTFHMTHRCHDRRFLFKFGVCRTEYRRRLRVSLKRYARQVRCTLYTPRKMPDEAGISCDHGKKTL